MQNKLLKAVELALDGQWDAAHGIVQQFEEDSSAAWIHAVLHKIEGDLDNSRYWYCRARKIEKVLEEPCTELALIKLSLSQ